MKASVALISLGSIATCLPIALIGWIAWVHYSEPHRTVFAAEVTEDYTRFVVVKGILPVETPSGIVHVHAGQQIVITDDDPSPRPGDCDAYELTAWARESQKQSKSPVSDSERSH